MGLNGVCLDVMSHFKFMK
jgi:hypothetical protein